MPLHDYIKRIYEEVNDPLYIVRFLNYLVNTRYKRVVYTVNGITVEPLITGVLEDKKTKNRFYSISEFYAYASGNKVSETDISVLSKVFVTKEYSVMRIICNIKEDIILNFFDQNYRVFLMYRDIRKHITHYPLNNIDDPIKLQWNNNNFTLYHTKLICDTDNTHYLRLLNLFEDGNIKNLYYIAHDNQYLITLN